MESESVSHAWCMYVPITHQYTSLHRLPSLSFPPCFLYHPYITHSTIRRIFSFTIIFCTTHYKPCSTHAKWSCCSLLLHYTQSVGAENVPWRVSEANKDYNMCETYPTILGVPASVNDDTLILASQFRSKGRMPVSLFTDCTSLWSQWDLS